MEPFSLEWCGLSAPGRRFAYFRGERGGYRLCIIKLPAVGAHIQPAVRGSARSIEPEDLHHGWSKQDSLKACIQLPVSSSEVTSPGKIDQAGRGGQLQLKLQAAPVYPRVTGTNNFAVNPFSRAAATSRRMNSMAL
jgi:hypothetical protein